MVVELDLSRCAKISRLKGIPDMGVRKGYSNRESGTQKPDMAWALTEDARQWPKSILKWKPKGSNKPEGT